MKRRRVAARGCRAFCRRTHGTTLIETAIVLPIFMMLLFALMDFSNVMLGYCSATYAARVTSRYASLHGVSSLTPCVTSGCTTAMVTPYIIGFLQRTLTVNTTWSAGASAGSTVTVNVSVAYTTAIPYSSLQHVTVSASSQRTVLH